MLPKLCLITDRKQCNDILTVLEDALFGGVRMIQLREKDLSTVELYNIACKIRKISKKYNSLLIINDRIDIALAVEADGIHVGKNSLPISAIKKLMSQHNHKLLIGYSTHSLKEAKELESEGVDWITFSPIYQSQSKSKYLSPKGLSSLEELVKNISIPVYALGGIKQTNIKDVMCTGVYGVALISEIISSNNPKQTANNLLSILDKDIK